jgi:hypothetical protein
MGRDQYPFVGQGIQSAVRIFRKFQVAPSQHFTLRRDKAQSVISKPNHDPQRGKRLFEMGKGLHV